MQSRPKGSRRGIALITSLAILVVVAILATGSLLTTQFELAISRNDAVSAQAQYVAQAGLQTYKTWLFQTFRQLESSGSSGTDACSNSLTTVIGTLPSAGAGTVPDASGVAIGSYTVTVRQDPANENRITVQSVGVTSVGGATRQARATASATFLIRNSSTLEQAIFAGTGSNMRFVNGNTRIHGGIYIVGNPLPADGSPPVITPVMQGNGNLSVLNGYDKTSDTTNAAFLEASARSATNLCAALRIERGQVEVGGSTVFGSVDNPLLTVAVGRGAVDVVNRQGLPTNPDCSNAKGICAITGITPFDIAEPPVFPRLTEAPDTEFCPGPATWRSCVRAEAQSDGMVLTTNGGSTISLLAPSGSGVALPTACLTELNAAAARSDKQLSLAGSSLDCTVTVNGLRSGFNYVATTPARLELWGNVNLRGLNLSFGRDVVYQARSRDADGVVRTFAGLSVESIGANLHTAAGLAAAQGGDFQAAGNFVADSTLGRFPSNVLSIIGERDVRFRGNQKYVTAPVYAGREFRMRGNTQLFGQVIADSFCTTSNQDSCSEGGNPAEIMFVPTGENRPRSFRAIAPTGGIPTFRVEAYELR